MVAETPNPMTLEWWTDRELAERWRVPVKTIRGLCSADKLPAMKVGCHWRIHRDTINEREGRGKGSEIQRPATQDEVAKALRVMRKRKRLQARQAPNHVGDF